MQTLQSNVISIAIDANCQDFMWYQSGVISTTACSSGIDHAVVMVGYKDNGATWIIRNSWGTSWGCSGYVYVARGDTSQGTLLMFSYNMYVDITC